jgi:hypothetical protein
VYLIFNEKIFFEVNNVYEFNIRGERSIITCQLSIFAENKQENLAQVTSLLVKENISIRATTISSSDTFVVISLIVGDPMRAEAMLTMAGVTVNLLKFLAVLIPDKPDWLDHLTQLLNEEADNISNAYGFVLESSQRPVFVVHVDQRERTKNS